jgi:hypothetical protein
MGNGTSKHCAANGVRDGMESGHITASEQDELNEVGGRFSMHVV